MSSPLLKAQSESSIFRNVTVEIEICFLRTIFISPCCDGQVRDWLLGLQEKDVLYFAGRADVMFGHWFPPHIRFPMLRF